MITLTLVVILGAMLAVVLGQLSRKPTSNQPSSPPPAPPEPASPTVADARPGDVISVSGAGDEMSDLDFPVDRLTRFDCGQRNWVEAAGLYRGRRVAVRSAAGDDTEAAVQADGRKLGLDDLGVTEDDLAQMDERQNTADYFEFDGDTWEYRTSREARQRADGAPPSGFYYWEFRSRSGKRLLAIAKSEGEPFAATVYSLQPAADVTVYKGGRS
jgi:hypothetical protein